MTYGSTRQELSGATWPGELAHWFKLAGYRTVYDRTQHFGHLLQNDQHLLEAGSLLRSGYDVCLLVSARILGTRRVSILPDHWIVLTKAVGFDKASRRMDAEVWSWGKLYPRPHGGSIDGFLQHYYGYVAARP
jgi:hypothetical protein